MPNCKHCGIPIHWDPARKSDAGKYIPIENETDQPHDCPENPHNAGGGNGRGMNSVDTMSIGNSITNLEDKMDELNKNMLKILSEVRTVKIRVEGQMPLFGSSDQDQSLNHLGDDSNSDLSS